MDSDETDRILYLFKKEKKKKLFSSLSILFLPLVELFNLLLLLLLRIGTQKKMAWKIYTRKSFSVTGNVRVFRAIYVSPPKERDGFLNRRVSLFKALSGIPHQLLSGGSAEKPVSEQTS